MVPQGARAILRVDTRGPQTRGTFTSVEVEGVREKVGESARERGVWRSRLQPHSGPRGGAHFCYDLLSFRFRREVVLRTLCSTALRLFHPVARVCVAAVDFASSLLETPNPSELLFPDSRGDSMAMRKKPSRADFHSQRQDPDGEGATGRASEENKEYTTTDLIQMGPVAVRDALEAQGRYSRKRRREHARRGSTGEDNLIRKWARVMGINLGYQIEVNGEQEWRHKSRTSITEEIVRAVAAATPGDLHGGVDP